MVFFLVTLACAAAAVLALLHLIAGENLRRRQKLEVESYLLTIKEVIKKRLEAKAKEKEKGEESKERTESIGEDKELTNNLSFLNKVARENPELFAKVVRRYVRQDPAVAAGIKRATDLEVLDSDMF